MDLTVLKPQVYWNNLANADFEGVAKGKRTNSFFSIIKQWQLAEFEIAAIKADGTKPKTYTERHTSFDRNGTEIVRGFPSILHEQSRSGMTKFSEPMTPDKNRVEIDRSRPQKHVRTPNKRQDIAFNDNIDAMIKFTLITNEKKR